MKYSFGANERLKTTDYAIEIMSLAPKLYLQADIYPEVEYVYFKRPHQPVIGGLPVIVDGDPLWGY